MKFLMYKDSAEINNQTQEQVEKNIKNGNINNFGETLKSCSLVSNKNENNEGISTFRNLLGDVSGNNNYSNEGGGSSDNNEELGNNEQEESREISLLHNEELPILLHNVFKIYKENKGKNNEIIRNRIERNKRNNPEEFEGENSIPTFDEFLLENDSEDGFSDYLLSDECIRGVILNYLKRYVKKDGSLGKISEKDLMSTIKGEWGTKLWREYNTSYELIDDDKYKSISEIFEAGKMIKNTVDKTVYSYISGGNRGEGLATQLDLISEFIGNKDSIRENLDEISLDHLNVLLKNSIKEYSRLIDKKDSENPLKKTNDEIFDLQIRSYLYLYGKIFYPNDFQPKGGKIENYESDLNDILLAILMHDGDIKNVKYNKFLKAETERAKKIAARQKEARERAFKRNRERNNGIKNREIKVSGNNKEGKIDVQTASGADIAREKNLGQSLNQFKIEHNPKDSEKMFLRRVSLRRACTNLLNEREDYRSYFSINDLLNFFDIDIGNGGLSFNFDNRNRFKSQRIEKNGNDENISKMGNLLFTVSNKYNKEKENLSEINNGIEGKCSEIIRNHAIGAVIDNVKNIFNDLTTNNTLKKNEGFRYDEATPVKIEKDCMIISGFFRGENIKVSYNVLNGEISINSFVSKNGDYLKIGNSENIIGRIEPFQQIFNNFCKQPTDSLADDIYNGNTGNINNGKITRREERNKHRQIKETNRIRLQKICGTKIDVIGDNIINEINNKTIINSTVSGMLKTLNILPENSTLENTTVLLKKNTDLYYFVETIQNSAKNDRLGLNTFIGKIPKLMAYLGLTWNGKNDHQDKHTELSKKIFNYKGDSNLILSIKENGGNFDDEISKINSAKFDNPENFGLLRIIRENLVEGNSPNQHLVTSTKINEYISKIGEILEVDNKIENI